MSRRPDSIAIVGLSGRYPGGANTPDLLWEKLRSGRDAVGMAQGDRWDLGFHDADPERNDRIYTRAGGFLDQIDGFDAEFFGISPREARQIDPQQRLLLELAWEALEDAAVIPKSLAGSRTGVFVGVSSHDYSDLARQTDLDAYSNTGSALSIAANRISYIFDLQGPSLAVDTACSSGLVAFHQGCRSLIDGESDLVLVGAANILAHAGPWVGFCRASMLSPDGRCKSFDASGNGFVRAEGGGMLVLKRLEEAERDGDRILAVTLASGVNSDGRTMGLSMPNGAAQEALLRRVYAAAGVRREDVFYVEAHGTGTAVGDPIECEAIGRVLGTERSDGSVCLIGSVKSNIGHLEPASGLAGMTKVLLALRHRELPANLHFTTPNPRIDFEGWQLRVVDTPQALPDRETPLVFGVNSFGFGGTNAHAVIEEYRKPAASAAAVSDRFGGSVLLLSAQSGDALRATALCYAEFLEAGEGAAWRNVLATAARCRSLHGHRLAVAATDAGEAATRLRAFASGEASPLSAAGVAKAGDKERLAFVYSGNGPQWFGMGQELLATNDRFRAVIEEIDAVFSPEAGWSLIAAMTDPAQATRMTLTEVAQPALFAVQAGVTALLREAGFAPALCFGHSVGEVAAAHAAGILSLEQAVQVIHHRSTMQARTAGQGKMAAIGIGAEDAATLLADHFPTLELAATNSPRAVTVAGDAAALEALCSQLTGEGRFARVLPLDYAFHSRAMDPIEAELLARLEGLTPSPGEVAFISSVEGGRLAGEALGASYWWRNVRAPVQFAQSVAAALSGEGVTGFVEIGPHPVLRDYIGQTVKAAGSAALAVATLRRPGQARAEPEAAALLATFCALHAAGFGDPATIFERPAEPAWLPIYAWQRQRHWRGAVLLPDVVVPTERDHVLLGWRKKAIGGQWENSLDTGALPFLRDHKVQDAVVFPAAAQVCLALTAGERALGAGALDLEGFEILRPLVLSKQAVPLHVAVDAEDGRCEIASRMSHDGDDWTPHIRTRVSLAADARVETPLEIEALLATLALHVGHEAHYADCAARELNYGPAFAGVRDVWLSDPAATRREAVGLVDLPVFEGVAESYRAHPAVLDGCLQVLISLLGQTGSQTCAYIPVQIERLRSFAPLPSLVYCHVVLTRETARSASASFTVTDASGIVLLTLHGARLRKVEFRSAAPTPILIDTWMPDSAVAGPATIALPAPALAPLAPVAADALQARMATLAGAFAQQALAALGARTAEWFTLGDLARRGRVPPVGGKLLRRLVAIAVEDGVLEEAGAKLRWPAEIALADPAPLWRALLLDAPERIAELTLIARNGELLVDRVRGVAEVASERGDPARDLLFDTAPFQIEATDRLRDALAWLVASWPEGRPIRVLEWGAGGPGLASALLPLLPPLRSHYVLADASEAAVDRVSQRLASNVAFSARHVPGLDGAFGAGSFDVVVAAGSLGAASDPQLVAERLASVLAPGGWLMSSEPTPDRMSLFLLGPDASPLSGAALGGVLGTAGFAVRIEAGSGQSVAFAQRGSFGPLVVSAPVAAQAEAGVRILAGVEDAAFAEMVADRLRRRGRAAELVRLGAEAMPEALAALARSGAGMIVHLAGLVSPVAGPALANQDLRCLALLQLVQAIKGGETTTKPRLVVVTNHAFAGPDRLQHVDPSQAPVWGLGRVLANEYPDLAPKLIDLHVSLDADAAALLVEEALREDAETEVMLAPGLRMLNRMRAAGAPAFAEAVDPAGAPFRLEIGTQGGLDALSLRPAVRRPAGPGEVEIRVAAAGLNFRDVLWTMGLLPEEAVEYGFSGATIGMECSGEIVGVGCGVTGLAVGDRVVAFASDCFGRFVTTKAIAVARIPDRLGLVEAATIPTVFLTAIYALDHLARLQPGERVLIHGAAGGVGLAAVQIAKLRGAEVFATAGSAEKRRVARLFGADHVLNSRSLDFADDVMRLTDGVGVDVVLNSLAGEAITRSLQCLRPFGRFLEIGKRDLYANSRVGLRPFSRNLSYFGIDADALLTERPDLAQRVFAEVMALMETGALRPIAYQALPVTRAAEAFRQMQQARHIGKILLTMEGAPVVARSEDVTFRDDGAYVVTGGLGGFGLATAQWMVRHGARHVALLGRRGGGTEEAQAGIAVMERDGATVLALAGDVTDRAALEMLLGEIRASMGPIRGVVHAAMVLDDAPIQSQTQAMLHRVLAPKLLGAWNLHEATLRDPIELFVMYSSGTTVVGNPGQANYVAANMALDSLAEMRRAQGLPALAVAWGAIKDVGVLARHTGVEAMLQNRTGLGAVPSEQALGDLGRLLAYGVGRASVAQFNMQRIAQLLSGVRTPRFLALAPVGAAASLAHTGETLSSMLAGAPAEERHGIVVARLRELVGRVLGCGAKSVDTERTLAEMGLDSLMAVELAEGLEQDTGQTMRVMQLIQAGSVSAIANLVLGAVGAGAA